jgi:heat shock protein HslJ
MKYMVPIMFSISVMALACAPKVTNTNPPAQVNQDMNQGTSLVGIYWKLIELNGKTITETNPKIAGFILLKADGTMTASAGCNSLMGKYELKNVMGIQFNPNMATTLMACPDQKKEDNFKKMLASVDNYAVAGDTLSFSKAKMAPLARFEKSVEPK